MKGTKKLKPINPSTLNNTIKADSTGMKKKEDNKKTPADIKKTIATSEVEKSGGNTVLVTESNRRDEEPSHITRDGDREAVMNNNEDEEEQPIEES
jgi:hypothetical protein